VVSAAVPSYTFLLVTKQKDSQWSLILQQALSALGMLETVPEEAAVDAVIQEHYDVVIIDAGSVEDVILLVSRLRVQRPQLRVVVATASPTWQRARQAFRAGSVDYIRKSWDEGELRSKIEAVLELP
jgi:DNA-binding response OmpR family regulator